MANAERITYYHSDALGSPVAATDKNGSTLWKEEYSPYGERQLKQADETKTVWFTGKQEEAEFGLQNFGGRWYDPALGRFTGVDPVGFVESSTVSFNKYAYANNNPYAYVDPDGEFPKLAIDFALNLALNYATTGELNVRQAVIDTAIDAVNPFATLNKAAKLGKLGIKAAKKARTAKSKGKAATEGIYEFTDTAGKKYCGQSCNIPNRLKQHKKTGKLDSSQSVQTTEVLGGKTTREIAEHKRIQEITGGVPARFSDKVSNKVDPIGPNRSYLLD